VKSLAVLTDLVWSGGLAGLNRSGEHHSAGIHNGTLFALIRRIKLATGLIQRRRAAKGAAGIMATTTKTKGAAKNRYNELKKMLEDRRRELLSEVQGRMRDVRADGNKERDVLDQGESSEVDIQEDIEFALIQMKSETLTKIDAALRRLEDGTYGDCFECGDQISEARLRALPFAVRCKDCEEARETAEQRERALAKRGSSGLFFDMSN
jgi:DnaK suppressor protein